MQTKNLSILSFFLLVLLNSCGGSKPISSSPPSEPVTSPSPNPGDGNELLSAINALRATGCRCGDGERMPAAPPLRWSNSLAKAAQNHTEDMARNNHFSHTGTNGSEVGKRAEQAGFNWSAIAENIAKGQQTSQEVVAEWQSSHDGHCQNMMGKEYSDMGMAFDDGAGGRFWTLVLGAPL